MAMRLILGGLLLGSLTMVAQADVVPESKTEGGKKDAPLEQQLLDDLGADLLDDLNSAEGVKPSQGKSDKRPAQAKDDDALDQKLLEDLDGLNDGGEDFGPDKDEDPFLTIGREMRKAGELIGERNSADETQQLQAKIVLQLDALIEQIRRQRSQQSAAQKRKIAGSTRTTPEQPGKNPSGSPAKQPARESEDRLNKGNPRKVDMAAMKALMKDIWGDLPERARQEMQQRSSDKFLPKYELKIEKYFRRLAEQRRDE